MSLIDAKAFKTALIIGAALSVGAALPAEARHGSVQARHAARSQASPGIGLPAVTATAAVVDPARSAANRALDEGRMPAAVLDFAGIKAGDVIADYQAGGGYYSELLASMTGPRGRVYAMTQVEGYKPEAWAPLTARHANLLPLVAGGAALQLAPGSVDTIFTNLVYHDLYFTSVKYAHPRLEVPEILAGWFAAVRPGGHVIVIDHIGPAGDPREVVEKFHRIDPATVKAAMTAAGFVLEAESDVLRRSEDTHEKNVFDPAIRGKTDRMMLKFRRT